MEQPGAKANIPARGRPSARIAILDAAANVVSETGARHLTLEAVAARAGVSKGGLLYHFPSKEDLLAGMVQRHIDEFLVIPGIFEQLASTTPGLGLKALVEKRKASVRDNEAKRETAGCLIAGAAEQPALLEPVRKFHKAIWSAIEGGEVAADTLPALVLAWFALEGEALFDLLNVSPLDENLKQQLQDAAMGLLEGRLALAPVAAEAAAKG